MDPFAVPPDLSSVAEAIRTRVRERPDAPAILAPGRTPLTYASLWRQIERTIGELRALGIGPGDRVALVLPNGPEMAVALVAAICGAVAAPVNPGLGAAEFEACLADLGARTVIIPTDSDSPIREVATARGLPVIELAHDSSAPAGTFTLSGGAIPTASETVRTWTDDPDAGSVADLEPESMALILQTSGTTARPKTFALDQAIALRRTFEKIGIARLTDADRCLSLMPLFHTGAIFNAVLSSLAVGGSVICAPGLVLPDFFDWIETLRPTWYLGSPAIHQAIVSQAPGRRDALARQPLRFVRSISAALSPRLRSEIEQAFGAPVVESYGLTETDILAYSPHPPESRKAGSVGVAAGPWVVALDERARPLPAGEVGELAIEESRVIRAESGDSAADAFVGGWFRTGDLGYVDAEHHVFVTGRVKELINRGGEKVSPQEVEAALLAHPDVAEAVVFALPHPRLGEGVGAAVVLRDNASLTGRTLREFAARRLARYKVPQTVLVLPEIPRGPTGKFQRVGLAERLGLTVDRPGSILHRGEDSEEAGFIPRDETEARLIGLWERLLGVSPVGVDDDFFALGGDSLLALQLLIEVEREFGTRFSDSLLYEASTVAGLATALRSRRARGERVSVIPIKPGGSRPPLFICLHVGERGATTFRHLANHVEPEQPLLGVQLRDIDDRPPLTGWIGTAAAEYVAAIVGHQPEGPYYLCGHSAAGIIAYETARQLVAGGHEVAFVGLIDTVCPDRASAGTVVSLAAALWKWLRRKRFDLSEINVRIAAARLLLRLAPPLRVLRRRRALWNTVALSEMYRRYRPEPYAGRLTLFLASRQAGRPGEVPQLGWRAHAAGGLDLREVVGNHMSVLTGEVRGFAIVLSDSLSDARNGLN